MKKILIVEDDPANAAGLVKLLDRTVVQRLSERRIQVTIEVVGTMAEGITHAESSNVTILDLSLPDSDTIESIQSIGKFRPPVIVMTGTDDPQIHDACILRGADFIFVKGQIHGLCAAVYASMLKDINALLHV